jgi:carbamate kinase
VRIVVAIGGNALVAEHDRGTWQEQLGHARVVADQLVALRDDGHAVVLTHGNGPHVGALLLQQALGSRETPTLPLDALIAMTQGQIGYLLETALARADPELRTATVLTRVVVKRERGAPPTKPVGPFYSREEAEGLAAKRGWDVAPDSGRGWRRVVESPRPVEIVGLESIRTLLESGVVVIAGGGGGIPVVRGPAGLVGVAGVIDKDRCAAELAVELGADLLVLLTGVARVALDFGTRWERPLERVTVSEALRGLEEGQFPPGSMGPKLESAARFVAATGGEAVIAAADRLAASVAGRDGTRVVADANPAAVAL